MSRPVVVYLVMIVVLVAGLWAVLEMGATLSPPEDLAGKWHLEPTAIGLEGAGLIIEQSGRFFQVAFEHGPQLDLKLAEQSPSHLLLSNSHWQLAINGGVGSDDKMVQLTGEQNGQWTAHRVTRTFPQDVSAREGH